MVDIVHRHKSVIRRGSLFESDRTERYVVEG
jgi:hypothetical protein